MQRLNLSLHRARCVAAFVGLFLGLSSAQAAEKAKSDTDIETIYIVQPKYRTLSERFELSLQGAYRTNNLLISESGATLSLLYHVKENFSVEALGGWMFFRGASTEANALHINTNHTAELARYYQFPWLAAFNFNWSVITGKALFHYLSLGQFNLYLTAGAGAMGLELNNVSASGEPLPLPLPVQFAANYGGGVRFYFTDHFGVKFEFKDYVVPVLVNRSDFPSGTVDMSSSDVQHFILAQAGVSAVF